MDRLSGNMHHYTPLTDSTTRPRLKNFTIATLGTNEVSCKLHCRNIANIVLSWCFWVCTVSLYPLLPYAAYSLCCHFNHQNILYTRSLSFDCMVERTGMYHARSFVFRLYSGQPLCESLFCNKFLPPREQVGSSFIFIINTAVIGARLEVILTITLLFISLFALCSQLSISPNFRPKALEMLHTGDLVLLLDLFRFLTNGRRMEGFKQPLEWTIV